ncbi:conserved hypothetical protein [Thiomonas delicata]|uniref:Uncharacterized protein n=1 Tax=Thiomonas delicata TaxID=364030 RepID=A0A238D208_THIDL|nr:conserved hypothetical protein [Thiomonas delicata]
MLSHGKVPREVATNGWLPLHWGMAPKQGGFC